MKTENDFNAFLSKQFRKVAGMVCVKASDKYQIGLSDFLIWYNGRSSAIESKFVKELPLRESSLILTHKFSGAQHTFLSGIEGSNNGAYGLVAVIPLESFYLIPVSDIPRSGNWSLREFHTGMDRWPRFSITPEGVAALVECIA